LRGAGFDREAAQWGKRNAIANFLPKVEVSSSMTRIDPESERRANASVDFIRGAAGGLGLPPSLLADIRPFAYRDEYSTGLTVMQPIYNGGAEIVGASAADAMSDRSEYGYHDAEQEVLARVQQSYYQVLKAEALLNLTKESAGRSARWLEMTKRRADLGSRTNTDVLRWEVQLAEDQGNIIQAGNALAAARLQLNEVMGVELDREYILEDVLPSDSVPLAVTPALTGPQLASRNYAPLIDAPADESLLAAHPAMRVMQTNLRLAEIDIDRSWVNFKPRVNLLFQYGWERNNSLNLDGFRPWALTLSVSFPIFNGFGDYTNVQMAKARYDGTMEQFESFRRGLLLQATNAQRAVEAARKRIEIARIGMEHAESVLGSVERRYDSGLASNVDMIDAQTAYTSAKTSYVTALYDYHISEVHLGRATGTLTQ
ncbi:MAG: TolC family protein, partial [Ignavibacteria bacterium]|nr:TolC family protein [Ignavibacteria bacterium]